MVQLQVRTFGKAQLKVDEAVVSHFPARQVEELLGYLLVNPNIKHSRLKLIDILWPDCSERKGRGRLNTAVWRLRSLLDDLDFPHKNHLVSSRDWVCFITTGAVETDFENFQNMLHQAGHENESSRREVWLLQAISLYQGEFFDGIYADWCLLERERLARLHLRGLGQLMHCYLQQEAYQVAAEIGQHILQVDPLREEIHRALMHCYRNQGLGAQAIRQFHRCADYLQKELAVAPLPETVALYNQIMAERQPTLPGERGTQIIFTEDLLHSVVQLKMANEKLERLLARYESSM